MENMKVISLKYQKGEGERMNPYYSNFTGQFLNCEINCACNLKKKKYFFIPAGRT